MKRAIPSLMVAGNRYDADAETLFNTAQITNTTVKNAVNTLIISAKINGWWALCSAIYGFAGDGVLQTYASQYKYNWKDPRDLDAAYRLTFVNSPTCDANGVDWNGTSQYASTHINAASVLSESSNHVSYYSRDNTELSTSRDIGANEVVAGKVLIFSAGQSTGNLMFYEQGGALINKASNIVNKAAFFLATRTAAGSPNAVIYRNNVDLGATYGSDGNPTTLPNLDIYIGGQNSDGVDGNYTNRQCAFATIGAGINGTIEALMYSDIQTYQTLLSRQV